MPETIVKCPGCNQKLRVPDDRGALFVTCGSCELRWEYSPPDTGDKEQSKSGLLNWLGKAKRSLTGDVADVMITELEEASEHSPAGVQVDVTVAEEPVKIKSVTLELICAEIVKLSSDSIRRKIGVEYENIAGDFVHRERVFESDLKLSGPMNLAADSTRVFPGSIGIPSTARPSFEGRCISNRWAVRAVLDTSSGLVNPKSKWRQLTVTS